MPRSLLFALLLIAANAAAEDSPLFITAAEWAQPRTGTAVMHYPALATAVARLQAGQRLQLLYPGGDEGSLWASELQAWLVALGLPSQRIELLPGSSREDAIEVRIAGTATSQPDKNAESNSDSGRRTE